MEETSQSIFELYKLVTHQKAYNYKVVKLFISGKKISICLFPAEIIAVDLKNPSFLEKRVTNGGKQTNSKKRVLPKNGKTFI